MRSEPSSGEDERANPQAKDGVWVDGGRREFRWAVGALTLSGVSLVAALVAFGHGPPHAAAWSMYALSMTLLLLALPGLDRRWTTLLRRFRDPSHRLVARAAWVQCAALAAILLLAAAVRLFNMGNYPAGIWYDEAANLMQAAAIADSPGSTPVFARVIPVFYLLPAAELVKLLGPVPEAIRLVSLVFSVAGIAAVFVLARLMMGPVPALGAAFILAVTRWDINLSHIGMIPVTITLTSALSAYLILRAIRSGRLSDFGFAGAALGLGMWFYAAFRLFPLVVGFVLLHHLILQRVGLRRFGLQVTLVSLTALAVAAPLVQFAIQQPDVFFARAGETLTLAIMPLQSAWDHMLQSLLQHLLMFHVEGDGNPRHNLPGAPMLDPFSGLLMIIGLVIALYRWRSVTMAVIPFWLVVMMLPGVLTLPSEAPQSLRSSGVLPAVVLLITVPMATLWQMSRSKTHTATRRIVGTAWFLLALVIAIVNIGTFNRLQVRDPRVYAAFSTDATLIGKHMQQQKARGYTLFSSRQYQHSLELGLAGNHPRYETITMPADIPIDATSIDAGAAIYLEPREASVNELLRTYYPEGRFEAVRAPGGSDVLFYLALIDKQAIAQRHGLFARYEFADGSATTGTTSHTEVFWQQENQVQRGDIPFDFVWEGALHVREAGEYVFELEGVTGVQVLLDGRPILGNDRRRETVIPAVGLHELRIMGTVEDITGRTRVLWQPPRGQLGAISATHLYHGPVKPYGLAGRFYAGTTEKDAADASRITPATDVFWYDPVLPEPYVATWRGTLDVPEAGEYAFQISGAGELMLFLDGRLEATHHSGGMAEQELVPLRAGAHRIRIDYAPLRPPLQFRVLWRPPGGEFEPLPVEKLTPAPDLMFRVVPSHLPDSEKAMTDGS